MKARLALIVFTAAVPALAQESGRWSPAGLLKVGRYAPHAALLPGGRVLVAGGYSFETNQTHATSELFDPATGAWGDGPAMRFDRNFAVPLELPGGDVLFAAGFRIRTGTTATTERLDARRIRFAERAEDGAPPAIEERELFSATRLADGRYLLAGGYSTLRRRVLSTAEIFDPAKGEFRPLPHSMTHARFGHAGILLPDGRVLIVGGKLLATNEDVLPAELFDARRERFTVTGSLRAGRDRCTAWLLPGAAGATPRVLVAGGSAKEGGTVPARLSEVYDPRTGMFTAGPEMVRDRMGHTATPLANGDVLLVGGWCTSENRTTRQAELWDARARTFRAAGLLEHGRHDHVAARLPDGRVLVAGGKEAPAQEKVETPLAAELWTPPAP